MRLGMALKKNGRRRNDPRVVPIGEETLIEWRAKHKHSSAKADVPIRSTSSPFHFPHHWRPTPGRGMSSRFLGVDGYTDYDFNESYTVLASAFAAEMARFRAVVLIEDLYGEAFPLTECLAGTMSASDGERSVYIYTSDVLLKVKIGPSFDTPEEFYARHHCPLMICKTSKLPKWTTIGRSTWLLL